MDPEPRGKFVYPQWIAGFGVTILIFQIGCLAGWASPTLAILTMPESPMPLNSVEASWVASLVNMGRLFGAIVGAVAINYLGSKRTIFVTTFPLALGWLIIGVAPNVIWLYIARLSGGFGFGMAFNTFAVYIGEVSMPKIRGALVSLAICGAPFGTIIASICSASLSLRAASFVYLSMCIILMVVFFFLPETPHHLIRQMKKEAAKSSIDWYRAGRGVDEEFAAVEKFVGQDESFMEKLREFRKPQIRNATYQIMALYAFMQIGGLNSILFYMEIILTRANITDFRPSDLVIYVNVCGMCSTALAILLIDKFGRRFLLFISGTGTAISMLGLSSYFLMMDLKMDTTNLQWIPMGSMFLFMITYCVGLLPVPSTMLSELFPMNVKCIAACLAGLIGAITAFTAARTYQPMVDLMGETYVFFIYAICSIIVLPYIIFVMPETKGKTLQQIQSELINV